MKIRCYCYQGNSVPLQGCVVTLYDPEGRLTRRVSNVNGICNFNGLCAGEYAVRQTAAPYYFVASTATHYCTLSEECPTNEAGFYNIPRFSSPVTDPALSPQVVGIVNTLRASSARQPAQYYALPPEEESAE